MGYAVATPVQELVIPEVLAGKDVIACAQTGTGKTAAFLLPLIHKIISLPDDGSIKSMVIVPTRELAIQIAQQIEGFGYFTAVSSLAVYGGGSGAEYANEQRALKEGVDIVVCTPGRMISHLNMGYVQISRLRYLVLDEADRMLDMGFLDDIMKIISFLPTDRQSLLFSATMPPKIRDLSRRLLNQPREITIALSKPPESIQQRAYLVYEDQKLPTIKYLLETIELNSILVFCDTKVAVKQLSRLLKGTGMSVDEIHADLEQAEREAVMNRFKSRQTRVLVATDIISRGIDVEDIDMVINYNVPYDAEDYIHRIGRTARAQATGIAVTLVGEKDHQRFSSIEKLLGRQVEKMNLPGHIGKNHVYMPDKRHSSHAGSGASRRDKPGQYGGRGGNRNRRKSQ